MTREDILRMAQVAYYYRKGESTDLEQLERFAALVAAAEREACAQMVLPLDESLADAIRARGDKNAD